jgi:hypothetical protein
MDVRTGSAWLVAGQVCVHGPAKKKYVYMACLRVWVVWANYIGGPTTCIQCNSLVLKLKVHWIVVLQLTNMWRFGPQSMKRWHMAYCNICKNTL